MHRLGELGLENSQSVKKSAKLGLPGTIGPTIFAIVTFYLAET